MKVLIISLRTNPRIAAKFLIICGEMVTKLEQIEIYRNHGMQTICSTLTQHYADMKQLHYNDAQ